LCWQFVLVFLFTPRIDYHFTSPGCDEAHLIRVLGEECQTRLHSGQQVEVLTNGVRFYPAMLAAIREARHSINVEAYIFRPGRIADQIVDALAERARAGVEVRVVLDAIGSSGMKWSAAGDPRVPGDAWTTTSRSGAWLHRANNRTHREL
jgi:cardiolipin synthase